MATQQIGWFNPPPNEEVRLLRHPTNELVYFATQPNKLVFFATQPNELVYFVAQLKTSSQITSVVSELKSLTYVKYPKQLGNMLTFACLPGRVDDDDRLAGLEGHVSEDVGRCSGEEEAVAE